MCFFSTKRICKWRKDFEENFKVFKSRRGSSFAHCSICNADFSVAAGGINDVKRHLDTQKHQSFVHQVILQPPVMSCFKTHYESAAVATAEIYFATFVAEHNLSFLCTDHFTKLCKVMFPDSKIAHSFSSGRRKTTAIIKHAIAPSLNSIVVKACQQSPITILCDGGSDQLGKNISRF